MKITHLFKWIGRLFRRRRFKTESDCGLESERVGARHDQLVRDILKPFRANRSIWNLWLGQCRRRPALAEVVAPANSQEHEALRQLSDRAFLDSRAPIEIPPDILRRPEVPMSGKHRLSDKLVSPHALEE